jgi:dipeptidyl aminopeptidase/acylaminoacyl peptidase
MGEGRRSTWRVTLALVLLALPARAAEKRPITETDLFGFVWVADPRISPDGTQVAFVRVTVDARKEGYDTAIWMVPADGSQPARPFTTGPRDSAPRWSPDGRTIAFLRAALKDGKREPAQIHLIGAHGGEARSLSDVPRGAGAPVWSPDGRSLAFTCSANAADLERARAKAAGQKEKEDERESDVRVITRSVYRFDGSGYLDAMRPDHVWVLDVPTDDRRAEARQLTRGEFDEGALAWSPDGARVFFTTDRTRDASYAPPDADLYSVSRDGGEPRREVTIDGPIGEYALAADGRRVAFVGFENPKPPRSYDQPDLFLAELGGGPVRNLTAGFDSDVASGITGDQRAPRGGLETPVVWRDAGSLVVKVAREGRGSLRTFLTAGDAVKELTDGAQDVLGYSASADGATFAVVVSTPTVVGDLFLLDARRRETRALYRPNAALFSTLNLTGPEEITYTSFDGRKVQAWIQKPPATGSSAAGSSATGSSAAGSSATGSPATASSAAGSSAEGSPASGCSLGCSSAGRDHGGTHAAACSASDSSRVTGIPVSRAILGLVHAMACPGVQDRRWAWARARGCRRTRRPSASRRRRRRRSSGWSARPAPVPGRSRPGPRDTAPAAPGTARPPPAYSRSRHTTP